MSENEKTTADDRADDTGPETGISDEQLPDDLVPGDDTPLAEPLDDDADVDDLLSEGKLADEMDDTDEDGESTPA